MAFYFVKPPFNAEIRNYELGINTINYSADKLSSGVYFYKLVVDSKIVDTKKMILLK